MHVSGQWSTLRLRRPSSFTVRFIVLFVAIVQVSLLLLILVLHQSLHDVIRRPVVVDVYACDTVRSLQELVSSNHRLTSDLLTFVTRHQVMCAVVDVSSREKLQPLQCACSHFPPGSCRAPAAFFVTLSLNHLNDFWYRTLVRPNLHVLNIPCYSWLCPQGICGCQ